MNGRWDFKKGNGKYKIKFILNNFLICVVVLFGFVWLGYFDIINFVLRNVICVGRFDCVW